MHRRGVNFVELPTCFFFFQSGRENYQGTEAHQLEIIQGSEGEATEVDISAQPQILITQGSGAGRDEGDNKHSLFHLFHAVDILQ